MIRKVLEIIKYNMKALIEFELIFKLLSLLIFTPIFLKSFTFIMKVTGFNYLTIENIFTFLFKPLTLVMLILLLLLMMVYVMFDITTIIVILDNAYHKKKITVRQAINFSLNKCKKIFKIKNISLAFLVLFLIPFLNIGLSSSFIATIKIPEFIVDFILHNKLLLVFCIMLVIFLIIVLLNWIYSLHYFVLEDKNFKEARKFSKNLSRKNHLKDVITIFLGQLAIFIIYMLFVFSGIILIVLFNRIFGSHILLKSIFSSIVGIFL